MSPMSSEPPLTLYGKGFPILLIFFASPFCFRPNSFCTAFARISSFSDQVGSPTFFMFSYISSAIILLKCLGQAVPSILDEKLVSVIKEAPSAILFAFA